MSKKANAGSFPKGKSGNPGGRPKTIAEVQDLAREQTPAAIAALVNIATVGKSEAARVSAAAELLNRAWGKAPQAVTGEGGEGPVAIRIERVIVRPQLENSNGSGL